MSPGYLIGGVPLDLPSGNELGEMNSPFVIEGDEYDSAFFDKRSKFIHYRPRVLILNNLEFDHGDIFRDLEDISRSFSHLQRIVPENGFILRNGDDENICALPDSPWCSTFSIGFGENNDFRIVNFSENDQGTRFELNWRGFQIQEVNWEMPGEFNARNLAMSFLGSVICQTVQHDENVNIKNPFIEKKLPNFSNCQGVKRRQEILINEEQLVVISDFGHHPTAIMGTLQSLSARWPNRKLLPVLNPGVIPQ